MELSDLSSRFSARARAIQSSAIRELLKVTERPDIISFAGGLPSPMSFPVETISNALTEVLEHQGQEALQYSPTEGYAPLREWIAQSLSTANAPVSIDNVLIVSGSQQGLDLLAKTLLDPEDKILVEAPTYLGALQAFSLFEPHYISVEADNDGLIPEAIKIAPRAAKMLYVLPNFQNPAGRLLSEARRHALVEKARALDFLILEDNPYGDLFYEEEVPTTLRALAPERTIYMGSFSKVLSPGLRLGYVIAPKDLCAKLTQIKQAADLHTSTLIQHAVYRIVRTGFLDTHLPKIRTLYAQRCMAMLNALDQHMPPEVSWNRPKGGMFLWLTLPTGINATELLKKALQHKIAFVPGEPFYATAPVEETLRLAFVTVPPEKIDAGIATLASLIRERMANQHAHNHV